MDSTFFQIALFTGVALIFGSLLLLLSLFMQWLFKIGTYRKIKSQEYECGVKSIGESRIQFDIKYYMFALLFIVFDVEFIFLMPWAMHFTADHETNVLIFLFIEALVFIGLLAIGLYYAYKEKALEWAYLDK